MQPPRPTASEDRTQQTFSALMWALSYPGRPQHLPAAGDTPLLSIADALIDLETSYYSSDAELDALLAHSGARRLPQAEAAYQFYPLLHQQALATFDTLPVGSHAYPDQAATLIIGCTLGSGQALQLRGPGILDTVQLTIAGVPQAFWALRAAAGRYPLGWDVFLVAADQVVGIPRTTRVEVL